ncbi:hypothetical protein AGMMS50239_11460 [Bacteroidia bacterium]|nr:hypothetical protein AGMMS50239_11460 [Bacteroidia bacterium]
MNNVLDLFKGVGVIVDDSLYLRKNRGDIIRKIRNSFKKRNIPLFTYGRLPSNEEISHFNFISFLLLDWDLHGFGSQLPQFLIDDNIDFIKQFNSVSFAPIFIFSNESKQDIVLKLTEAGLYDELKSNHIFVESKTELKDAQSLFSKIEDWVKQTPSIYVLKEWELALQQAKNSLFWDFYKIHPEWAKVLSETFKNDGADIDSEFISIIYKNLIARTQTPILEKDILKIEAEELTKEDLRKILECERFLKQNNLPPDVPATGDIFKEEYQEDGETKYRYFVNIRPDCDIIRGGQDTELYCLKGRIVDEDRINAEEKEKSILFKNGCFEEKIAHAYISFIDGGKIVEFLFQDIKIKKWKSIKVNRIGRLLPPYITRLQQKYTFYLQRQALPAIPDRAIK